MRRLATALLFALIGCGAARADEPVKIVVPFAAGGPVDAAARLLAQEMQGPLGATIVVENRAGGGGVIAADYVSRAAPDGKTLLLGSQGSHVITAVLQPHVKYDPVKSFDAIAMMGASPTLLVANPQLPFKDFKDLVALAKTRNLSYASAGPGSTNHLCAALFAKMTGVEMVHVPYRGGAPAVADTVGGQTQLFFTAGTQSLEYVKAGRLRLLAVTEEKRSSLLPDVPTVAETVPGYEMAVWYGAFGPAGMPPAIVAKLNAEIGRILFLPDVKGRMDAIAVEVARMTPDELGALTRRDADKWGKLIKELGVTPQ